MKRKYRVFAVSILCSAFLAACGSQGESSQLETIAVIETVETIETIKETETNEIAEPMESAEVVVSEEAMPIEEFATEDSVIEESIEVSTVQANGCLIVIDPGHQQKGNSEKEPIGPGAEEMKAKVAAGTRGCVSGLAEYELTLQVGLKLQEELTNRGYEVLMVRTTHDVNISNSERAQIANEAGADAFIRIHADGLDNSEVHGASTLCQTPQNPYNGNLYEQSRALSETVLDGIAAETGCKKRSVQENDTMSGINWCQVPVTIVEMGFMTNPEEDALMATEDYQYQLARGMADGIDKFLAN